MLKLNEVVRTISDSLVTVLSFEDFSSRPAQLEGELVKAGFAVVSTENNRSQSRANGVRYLSEEQLICRLVRGELICDVLVISDLSEWRVEQEMLLGVIGSRPRFKMVIIAEREDVGELRRYYENIAHIHVSSGSSIPILDPLLFGRHRTYKRWNLIDSVLESLNQGNSCLVIVTGKRQIEEFVEQLQNSRSSVKNPFEVFSLHGNCTESESERALRDYYPIQKVVVATNIVEHLPVPGIKVIYDSGMVNRRRVIDGVDGVHAEVTSLSEQRRRMRASSGVDIVTYFECLEVDTMGNFGEKVQRRATPEPEMNRVFIDKVILQAMASGVNLNRLRMIHQPSRKELDAAMRTLETMGCVVNGEATETGRRCLEIPTSIPIAKMILEAERRGVLGDVIDFAAILQAQGILEFRDESLPVEALETRSDLFLQSKIFRYGESLTGKDQIERWRELGVHPGRMLQARRCKKMILDRIDEKLASTGDTDDILKSVAAGLLANVFWCDGERLFNVTSRTDERRRRLDRKSQLVLKADDLIVGIPLDLSANRINSESGGHNISLVILGSKIEAEWLEEVAPHLFRCEKGSEPYYRADLDEVWSEATFSMGDRVLKTVAEPDPNNEGAGAAIAGWLARMTDVSHALDDGRQGSVGRSRFSQIVKRNRAYLSFGDSTLTCSELKWHYLAKLRGARSFAQLERPEELLLLSQDKQSELREKIAAVGGAIEFLGVWRELLLLEGKLSVKLSRIDILDGSWKQIPDGELTTSEGEVVEVAFQSFYSGRWFQTRNLSEVRARIGDDLRRQGISD